MKKVAGFSPRFGHPVVAFKVRGRLQPPFNQEEIA